MELSEAARQLRSLVEAAAHRKLARCLKVGILLSGGLDSAIVASEAARVTANVVVIHWNWKALSILSDEQKAAESVANKLGIELMVRDFSASISEHGDYLKSMKNLTVPFNHSFFHCFMDSATAAGEQGVSVIASGHLGDAAFQGHWSDPIFAELIPVWSPLSLIRTFGSMLTQESRVQITRTLLRLLRFLPEERELGAQPRIALCAPWLTPSAFEKAQELGCHLYHKDLPSSSSRSVYNAIKQGINGDAELDTGTVTHAFLPKGIVLLHPYADRTLLEFCLSLGPQHRTCFHAGGIIHKLILRLAYVGALPQGIVGREIRAPYVAVAESYCRNNQSELTQILGEKSLLARLEVIDYKSILEILNSPSALQRTSPSLIRAAGVEMWLRCLNSEG